MNRNEPLSEVSVNGYLQLDFTNFLKNFQSKNEHGMNSNEQSHRGNEQIIK